MHISAQVAASKLCGRLLAAAVCAVVCIAAATSPAQADGGVTCTGISLYSTPYCDNSDTSSVCPMPPIVDDTYVDSESGLGALRQTAFQFAVITFDKNVSYPKSLDDDAFIDRNLERIRIVRQRDGYVVASHAFAYRQRDDRKCLYLFLDEWMDPLTDYEIVVDAGIEAANEVDVMDEEYRFAFKTGSLCKIGLTVFQIGWIVGAAALLAVGVVWRIRRVCRERS